MPQTYAVGGVEESDFGLHASAVAYGGPQSALSHTTALDVYGLLPTSSTRSPRHITIPRTNRRPRGNELVAVHRKFCDNDELQRVRVRDGLPVVCVEQALVEAWPLVDPLDRPAPAVVAVRERQTTPQRVRQELASFPNLTGRAELVRLIELMDAGCRSWLEVFGVEAVLEHPSLPPTRGQVPVEIGGRMVYLDRLFDEEMVNVELDGHSFTRRSTGSGICDGTRR